MYAGNEASCGVRVVSCVAPEEACNRLVRKAMEIAGRSVGDAEFIGGPAKLYITRNPGTGCTVHH